ncbi:MAG TPA: T9SS type A sorting domain-containing protein [Bacteroidia bacterium]|jgi:predicted dienelactone hydrolase
MKKIILFAFLLFSLMLKAQTYQVGHVQITYTDPARGGRSIQTEIYYPAATAGTGVPVSAGTYPVIVFGHGFVMAWDSYQNIWDDLVPQGYIVAFPRTEGSISPNHAEFGKDLKFLITKLQSESAVNAASLLYNHINTKSAIMGHSMGGGSAFLAAESNPGITTMVTFAAANTTPSSIGAAQNVTVPALVFSGQNDCVAPPADHQIKMYDSLASACKTFVSIKGGAHCEFANSNFNCSFGQSTCSPAPTITRTQQQDAVSDFLKLWLEYYLKDNCTAWDTFNDSLAASPRITYDQQCEVNSPVITQSGLVLSSTSAASYQWFWNGTLIPGANAQNYITTAGGNYYVEVTYLNSCLHTSNIISMVATGLNEDLRQLDFLIYPNPAKDLLGISLQSVKQETVMIRIVNVLGMMVIGYDLEVPANQRSFIQKDISGLEKGVYLVEMISEGSKQVHKMVKQ